MTRLLYQGLFNAANVVGEACKGAALVTEVMNGLGYESNPKQVEILRFSKTTLLVIHTVVVLGLDAGMRVCVCVCVCVCNGLAGGLADGHHLRRAAAQADICFSTFFSNTYMEILRIYVYICIYIFLKVFP